ncbi:TetR family transcriptional regulator [Nonomuraea sp. NPDC048901]|uniref:TetR/AcrR family transcriptional regulator n=1 Tax=Nonomuraea sp. NPDC048901 TaxID=3155627 RepID=UPI0033E98878
MTTRRRAVTEDERGTAAERTRERILRAALEEFGAKGYSGARTAAIAARAGVNQQLISYHFGGKQGLLTELRRRWTETGAGLPPPESSFADSFAAVLGATLERPQWARMVLWQALGDDPGEGGGMSNAQREQLRDGIERLRRRQRDGEISDAPSPEFVMLLAYALTFAPLALPDHVKAILGVDPLSEDYRRIAHDQLMTLLRGPAPDDPCR